MFIGLPNTGKLNTELVFWLLKKRDKINVFAPMEKPHDHCRNIVVEAFLKSKEKWLLMIDSDIVPPDDILEMAANDVPVCSAFARISRGGELVPVGMTKTEKGYHHNFDHSKPGLHKVDAVGTGCIMIRRDVFDRLDKPYFKFVYNKDGMLINGEDFDFSERVGEVYFDSRYICKHLTKIYI